MVKRRNFNSPPLSPTLIPFPPSSNFLPSLPGHPSILSHLLRPSSASVSESLGPTRRCFFFFSRSHARPYLSARQTWSSNPAPGTRLAKEKPHTNADWPRLARRDHRLLQKVCAHAPPESRQGSTQWAHRFSFQCAVCLSTYRLLSAEALVREEGAARLLTLSFLSSGAPKYILFLPAHVPACISTVFCSPNLPSQLTLIQVSPPITSHSPPPQVRRSSSIDSKDQLLSHQFQPFGQHAVVLRDTPTKIWRQFRIQSHPMATS